MNKYNSIINNTIFWKYVTRPFRCLHVNCFKFVDLDFLLRSIQKCKKCSFLDNFRTITQERIMETGQITLFYFIYFLPSNCLYHSFLNLRILKIHFHVVALWIVLACKTPQFLEKSYQFRQLIILFQNVGTLRLLRI